MSGRWQRALARALREAAVLPIRALNPAQRAAALAKLQGEMITNVDTPNGILHFVTSTPLLQSRAHSALSKEPDTIRWIDTFHPSDVLWDIGANVGVFSLYAAQRKKVRVVAFEPSADNFAALCQNVHINALAEWIVPYCLAFAGKTELGILNSASRDVGAALHHFGMRGEMSRFWTNNDGICAQGMIGYTVDDFIRDFDPPFPTHFKLDVDGLEESILAGAEQTFRDRRLQSLMVELTMSHSAERQRAIEQLFGAGFELYMEGAVQESGGETAANHFFRRR